MRFIPETFNRDDWPRLVAQAVNGLLRNGGGTVTLSGGFVFDDNTGTFLLDDL